MANTKKPITRQERRNAQRASDTPQEKKPMSPNAKRGLLIGVISLGLAFVVAGVAIMVYFLVTPSFATDRPVARIELEFDGRRHNLDIELFPEYSPASVRQFLFLARQGFFDNTIISDVGGSGNDEPAHLNGAQHGFVRFAGFETPTRNRATNTQWLRDFPQFRDDRGGNMLGYRLREPALRGDNIPPAAQVNNFRNSFREQYTISMITSGWTVSTTAFQIAANTQNQYNVQQHRVSPGAARNYTAVAFGRVLGAESRALVRQISAMDREQAHRAGQSHNFFRHPVTADGFSPRVIIRRVRVFQPQGWSLNAQQFRRDVIEVDPTAGIASRYVQAWSTNPPSNWE